MSIAQRPTTPARRGPVADFFMPKRAPGTLVPGLVSSAIATATVLICCALFGPALGVISLLGALTTFWETGRPLWARVRNSLLVTVCISAAMAAGVAIAPLGWAVVPLTVAIILLVSMAYHTFMLTAGPSPVMMFYAAVLGTFFGLQPGVGWRLVGVTVVASLLTSVFLLVPLVFGATRPERSAIDRAEAAVRALETSTADDDDTRQSVRHGAFRAATAAALTVRSAWPAPRRRRDPLTRRLVAIQARLARAVHTERPLASSSHGPANTSTPVAGPTLPARPRFRYLLGHAIGTDSFEWFTSWRMGLAAGVAGVVSQSLGIGHPYWAILTATVVINQWSGRAAATRRAAHRALGTLLGVVIVGAVSALPIAPWVAVVIVVACMVGQYLTFPVHYALALVFITPMALIAVDATGSGSVGPSALDRLVDTLIGAAVAVAVTWTTSRFFPARIVRAQSARARAAVERLGVPDPDDPDAIAQDRAAVSEVLYELTHHLSVLDRAVADDRRLASVVASERAVADRGYDLVATAWLGRSADSTEGGAA